MALPARRAKDSRVSGMPTYRESWNSSGPQQECHWASHSSEGLRNAGQSSSGSPRPKRPSIRQTTPRPKTAATPQRGAALRRTHRTVTPSPSHRNRNRSRNRVRKLPIPSFDPDGDCDFDFELAAATTESLRKRPAKPARRQAPFIEIEIEIEVEVESPRSQVSIPTAISISISNWLLRPPNRSASAPPNPHDAKLLSSKSKSKSSSKAPDQLLSIPTAISISISNWGE